MELSGTIDSSVYEGLRDALQRHPAVTSASYESDSVIKKLIQTELDPSRVVPAIGSEPPTFDVEWRFVGDEPRFWIHYADSNTGFNCGWHRDGDHLELGAVRFRHQYFTKHLRLAVSEA